MRVGSGTGEQLNEVTQIILDYKDVQISSSFEIHLFTFFFNLHEIILKELISPLIMERVSVRTRHYAVKC